MKGTLLSLAFIFAFFTQSHAQAFRTFKGRLVDSATSHPLGDATISIYRASDTSLLNFGFTTPLGNFNLTTKFGDSLMIIFSLLNYGDKVLKFPAVEGWHFMELPDIKLNYEPVTSFAGGKIKMSAIRMHGDTIEINASRFKVLPGSDVAQLFKKIPGFEVNVKGEIKVNGSEVSKIMVDGSDFFGNNPGLVSKNLNADMIETVQVFDDKNEDGSPKENTPKVINLKLKKGKRNGLFGDLLAGAGNQNRYEAGARLNSFKNDRKFSVIFNKNNINGTGFDFGFNNWHSVDNYSRNGGGNDDFYYFYNQMTGEGNINNRTNFGTTYFNEFSRKRKFSFNVDLSHNNYSSISSSNSIYALNDTTNRSNKDSVNTNGISNRLYLNVNYSKQFDSTGYFEIGADADYRSAKVKTQTLNNIRYNELQVNGGEGKEDNNTDNAMTNLNVSYRRNLRKDKRYVFSAFSSSKVTQYGNDRYQYQQNRADTFNLLNNQSTYSLELLEKLFGRMPIYKNNMYFNLSADRWFLSNVSKQTTNSAIEYTNKTFEQSYSKSIDTLSIRFNNTQTQYTVKPYVSYEKKHFYASFSTTLMNLNLKNDNKTTGQSLNLNYFKVLPSFSVNYYPEGAGWFYMAGSKSSKFPTINDLQPVLNLANNYDRTKGNANLQPEDDYSFRTYANMYKIKGFKQLYFQFSGNVINNARIYSKSQNENGILVTTPVNANGKRNMFVYLSANKKITKTINFSLGGNYNLNRDPLLINGNSSFSLSKALEISPGLNFSKSDSLELSFNSNIRHNDFRNMLNSALNYKQYTYSYSASIRTLLKFGMEINSTLDIQDQRKVPNIGKIVPVWSLYLQQPIGKTNYSLKFTAYDIFKQNTQISRYSSDNFVVINRSNQLQQYFMMTLIYKIKKMGNEEENQYVF